MQLRRQSDNALGWRNVIKDRILKIWNHPVGGLAIVLSILGIIGSLISFAVVSSTTPAERASREVREEIRIKQDEENAKIRHAAELAARDRDSLRAANNRYLCELRSLCERYASVRQECATAGNYEKCIEIKTGYSQRFFDASCRNDGSVDASIELPNRMQCLGSSILDRLNLQ